MKESIPNATIESAAVVGATTTSIGRYVTGRCDATGVDGGLSSQQEGIHASEIDQTASGDAVGDLST